MPTTQKPNRRACRLANGNTIATTDREPRIKGTTLEHYYEDAIIVGDDGAAEPWLYVDAREVKP